MNNIVYVGMDVFKESYTLCCYCYDTGKVEYKQIKLSDYRVVKNLGKEKFVVIFSN